MRGVTAVSDIYEGDVVEMTQAQFLSICEANKGFGLDPADKNRRDHAFGECKKATDKTNCEVRGVLDYDCRNTHNPNPNETPQQCIERRLAGSKWDPKVAAASPPPAQFDPKLAGLTVPPPPPPRIWRSIVISKRIAARIRSPVNTGLVMMRVRIAWTRS